MKKIKLVHTVLLLIVFSASGQTNESRVNELVICFQKNLEEGLDISSFNTISDQDDKAKKVDAFINSCKAKGMIAQTQAVKTINLKLKDSIPPDNEIVDLLFSSYKEQIPNLKESYLEFVKLKCKIN